MASYVVMISITVIGLIGLSTFIIVQGELSVIIFPEAILHGNITGVNVTSDDGQSYIEYSRIPLFLRKNTTENATIDSNLENALNSNDTDGISCSFKNNRKQYDNCLLFNVYTKVNISKTNESLPRLPVTFYVLQKDKQYPKYNPSLGEILVTVEDMIPSEDMDFLLMETTIPQITMVWISSVIEKFGGDPVNVRYLEDVSEYPHPQLEEPPFAVGYELSQSNNKIPIRLSESKKFIQRKENSFVIALIEETTTSQDDDNYEQSTISQD